MRNVLSGGVTESSGTAVNSSNIKTALCNVFLSNEFIKNVIYWKYPNGITIE